MYDFGFFEGIARELSSDRGAVRLLVSPAMSVVLGARFGVADAKEGHEPFLVRLRHGERRGVLLESVLVSAGIPLLLSFVLDGVLQYVTLGHVRPLVAVVVGAVLVWLPFWVVRSATNRLWRRFWPPHPAGAR
jgi:hypothetical protein